MMLEEYSSEIELPQFLATSFSGSDQAYYTHNELMLSKVKQLESGNLRLTVKAKEGSKQIYGKLRFKLDNVGKKEYLYKWLSAQIGETIDSIYRSEFSFGE